MRTGRAKVELLLTDEERSQLQSIARSRSLPAALGSRVRIILSNADGDCRAIEADQVHGGQVEHVDNYATHSHPKIRRGWRLGRAGKCTSSRPAVPGSIMSSDSSR